MLRVIVRKNGFRQWIIVPEGDPRSGWSGSRFVPIDRLGLGITVQVSNFETRGEAMDEADRVGFEVVDLITERGKAYGEA